MWNVITQLLQSKKAVVALVTVAAQVAAHFGFHVDQAELTTALSPLYTYIIGQAIADHGKGAAEVNAAFARPTGSAFAAPAAKQGGFLKLHVAIALSSLFCVLAIAASCLSSSQTTKAKETVTCTAADADKLAGIMDDKTLNGYQKLIAVGQVAEDVRECVLRQAAAAGSATGSAK